MNNFYLKDHTANGGKRAYVYRHAAIPGELVCNSCLANYQGYTQGGTWIKEVICPICAGTGRDLIPFSEVWGI